jgi:hypothetical protein
MASNLFESKVLPAMVNALLRINDLRVIDIWQYFLEGTKNTINREEAKSQRITIIFTDASATGNTPSVIQISFPYWDAMC